MAGKKKVGLGTLSFDRIDPYGRQLTEEEKRDAEPATLHIETIIRGSHVVCYQTILQSDSITANSRRQRYYGNGINGLKSRRWLRPTLRRWRRLEN